MVTLFNVTTQLFDQKSFVVQLFNVTEQSLNELLRKYRITFYKINNDFFLFSIAFMGHDLHGSTHDFNELKLINYMGNRYIPYLFNL